MWYYWTTYGGVHDVDVNVLDCDIVVNEFEFQSSYDVHIRTDTIGKCTKSLISLHSYGLDSTTTVLQ